MKQLGVIILAAGIGKRMKSKIPKVMHKLCGKTMLSYVIDTALALNPEKTVIVVSPKMNKKNVGAYNYTPLHKEGGQVELVVQDPPHGTGDAVLQAESIFKNFNGSVFILCGDVPLITPHTLNELKNFHYNAKSFCTILTAVPPNPSLYGKIVRKGEEVLKIVEDSDASPEEKKISEINTGIYLFNCKELFNTLHKIHPSNVQGEYYLTDTIEILCNEGKRVSAFSAPDWQEVSGINTRKALAEIEKVLQAQKLKNK